MSVYFFALVLMWGKARVSLNLCALFSFFFKLFFLPFAQCELLSVLPHLVRWILCFSVLSPSWSSLIKPFLSN